MIEEVELLLSFKEVRVRGSAKTCCVVEAKNADCEDEVSTIEAASWETLIETYPTLPDIVEHFFWAEHWRADVGCGPGDRDLVVQSMTGHEGLYDWPAPARVRWSNIRDNDVVYLPDGSENLE